MHRHRPYLNVVERIADKYISAVRLPNSHACVLNCNSEGKSTARILSHDVTQIPDKLGMVL